jgi:hypothetical protein
MMNDEYLWNKTGSDTEIEELENALKAYRYQEKTEPCIPMRAVSFAEKRSSSIWPFGFALAFASAVVFFLSAVWFLFPAGAPTLTDAAVSSVPIQSLPLADVPGIESITAIKISRPETRREFVKIRQAPRTKTSLVRVVAKTFSKKHPQVQLTAEEKYAYDQLMLALSITSSKLKIVKDTVGQIDKPETAIERYR